MNTSKPWWQSKTMWSGLTAILSGLAMLIFGGDFDTSTIDGVVEAVAGVVAVLAGTGTIIGRLTAVIPLVVHSIPDIEKLRAEIAAAKAAAAELSNPQP